LQTYPFTIALFSYFIIATAFGALRHRIKTTSDPNRLPPRQGDELADRFLGSQLNIIVLILFIVFVDHPRPIDFGYKGGEFSVVFSFLLGIVCYAAFVGAYNLFLHVFRVRKQQLVASYIAHRTIWPRAVDKRRKLYTALLLNPVTEELLYRGFLVFYLGHLFDSVLLFSILGIAVCMAIHLYQGVRMLPFHAGFCLVSILILFSPLGIVGCIGMHFAGDFFPLTQIKQQQQAWKNDRRRERPVVA
jgi:membrane protease YdiL (CAAX protease family)